MNKLEQVVLFCTCKNRLKYGRIDKSKRTSNILGFCKNNQI